MKNRKFKDLSNDKIVKVTDQFEDIIILDGKSKIRINQLLDKRLFEEYVDPSSFFNNEGLLSTFTEQIKKIPLDDWNNRIPAEEMGYDSNQINTMSMNESVVMPYDPEIEKQELLRKAQTVYNTNNTNLLLQKQKETLKHILDDDDTIEINQNLPNQNQISQQPPKEIIKQQINEEIRMDPILEMFKNVKRNTSFKIDFTVENKIPRVDFIEMMEDSYNTSIIEFLAQEFTDDILRDPNKIKEKIKKKLTDLVYPEVENLKKSND